MAKVNFKLNLKGLNELMKSKEMQSVLDEAAGQIANNAGDGYVVEAAHPIRYIGIASVRAATSAARRDNSTNNTLEKAIGSVKL